jgi:hypothetical protein
VSEHDDWDAHRWEDGECLGCGIPTNDPAVALPCANLVCVDCGLVIAKCRCMDPAPATWPGSTVAVDWSKEDGEFVARVLGHPGLSGGGANEATALCVLAEALAVALTVAHDDLAALVAVLPDAVRELRQARAGYESGDWGYPGHYAEAIATIDRCLAVMAPEGAI